jgi:hypothetical protein
MTEQEWLEDMADRWMDDAAATPAFNPDLPAVSECGWRSVLPPLPLSGSAPHEWLRYVGEVEFYAVFRGREITTRRPLRDMNQTR